jgi:putative ABC transport system permease protein
MQDLRYAVRMMRRAPGFTAVTILSLALGIGANTAIFSLINALMLRPLPVRNPSELVQFLSLYPDPGEPPANYYAWKYYQRFRDQTHAFSEMIGVSPSRFHLRADGIDADAVDGEYVVGNYFSMLGVTPAIGRLFRPQDDVVGSAEAAVAVLSWASWTKRFHADPSVLGTRLVIDGVQATVVGVAPRRFFGLQLGAAPEIWLPVAMEPLIQRPSRRASGELSMSVMARLKPGVPLARARAELLVIDRDRIEEIARRGDLKWRQVRIDVVPAAAGFSTLTYAYAKPLFALMAIVSLLLLLACTNVASLLLARGAARQREMTLRVALGAGRLRLVRQVLTESLLLAAAGCLLGIVLAYFGADALMRIVTSGRIVGMPAHIEFQPQLDLRVLLFTAGVSLITGVLFGLVPALSAFDPAPAASLRTTGAAPDTPSRRLIGKGLVVAQVALSVMLLTAAGLFVRHVATLRNVGLGFERESVLLVTLDPTGSGYQGNQLAPVYRQLLARLAAIPGVRSATLSGVTPISGAGASRFVDVPGFQEKAEDRRRASLNWAGPSYFETLGIPRIAGRDFAFEDEGRPRVAIVSASMARYYYGDRSPIGQIITFDRQPAPYEIVGVVGDAKYLNLHEPIPRMVYLHAFQEPRIFSHELSLRTSIAPAAVANDVRRAVRDVTRTVTVAKVTTLTDQIDASIIPERLMAVLSGFFAGLGALLAAIGLYGLLAYTVARRTNEIGIRIALGATRRDVMWMVQGSSLALVGAGLALGIPLAWISERVAAAFVDNLAAGGGVPIGLATAALIAVAMLAAYVPARRAARVNPIEALRQE